MLISLAKLYAAFNLSPQDLGELLHLLPNQPVIPLRRLIIDPTELRGRENEPPLKFSFELARNMPNVTLAACLASPEQDAVLLTKL